jgi:predicted DNA-binding antitoxin AbrB/MazE fold protein
MSTAIKAVYEKGPLRPLQQLELAEGEKVSVVLFGPMETKLVTMRVAMSDPLFLADLKEMAEDFQHVDAEGSAQ